jgi:predicted enzyme related to lactoylglutathione lyase
MTTTTPGTPNWVDLASPDVGRSTTFYSGLFGWDAEVQLEPEAGGYTMFRLNGKSVAGVGPIMMEGQPSAWTTYVATDDADDTTDRVTQAGGTVIMPPMDVMDYGRMAVFQDPTGAAFATWQAGTNPGGEVFNVPGALTWNELETPDVSAAKEFYGTVFGWIAQDDPMGPSTYTTFKLGERGIGGMMPLEATGMTGLPPHWMTYFAVEDTDDATARAAKLGGTVLAPPMDTPAGRMAALQDPTGASFSVIAGASSD